MATINGTAVNAVTDANFAMEIDQSRGLAVVDFWAEWCGPCRMVGPVVEQLAGEYGDRVKEGKLDVDANPQTAARFNIRSLPSILVFKDGRHVDTVVGAVPRPVLERRLQEHL